MQLALHYPNLTPVSRKRSGRIFFDLLQEDSEEVDIDKIKLHIDGLADREMNGREIRMALMTTRRVALYKKETCRGIMLNKILRFLETSISI
jgi:hypothetical protein